MGCDYDVNVGPVVVIHNPPVDTTETTMCCCNKKCKTYHQMSFDKFCTECGNRIAEWIEPVVAPKKIDFYEVLKETLVPADHEHSDAVTIVLVPNKNTTKVGFQSFDLKSEPFEVYPKVEEIVGNIEKFKELFKEELKVLKGIFGPENVDVRYGVVGTINC